MKPAKKTTAEKPRRGRAPKGFEKMMIRVDPAQGAAVREEAYRRAKGRGRVLVDASEVVREAIALWMARKP